MFKRYFLGILISTFCYLFFLPYLDSFFSFILGLLYSAVCYLIYQYSMDWID